MSKRANAFAVRQQKQTIKKNQESDFKSTHRRDMNKPGIQWIPKNWSEITNKKKRGNR